MPIVSLPLLQDNQASQYLSKVNVNLCSIIDEKDKYIAEQQELINTLSAILGKSEDDNNIWLWQGDGYDHPESMVRDLRVIMTAAQLRDHVANEIDAALIEQSKSRKIYRRDRRVID